MALVFAELYKSHHAKTITSDGPGAQKLTEQSQPRSTSIAWNRVCSSCQCAFGHDKADMQKHVMDIVKRSASNNCQLLICLLCCFVGLPVVCFCLFVFCVKTLFVLFVILLSFCLFVLFVS